MHSKLFEKPENLHLYLPMRSAHPPGVLHGLIAGNIFRSFSLCTDENNAKKSVHDFWVQLTKRGYSSATLKPIFEKALNTKRTWTPPATSDSTTNDLSRKWFFKLAYHPQGPPSALIQQAWDRNIANPRDNRKPLAKVDVKYNCIGERRFIVCYKRAPNIGNLLSYRKILPESGSRVSSFVPNG